MFTHLQRRKCIIASVLVVEIVLFSIITFVIAYVSSLNAIHHTSQQLADSMVDTVSVRITAYLTQTEHPIKWLATQHSNAVLPIDDHSGVPWYTEWLLELRSLMQATDFDASSYAVLFDDSSDVDVITTLGVVTPAPWVREDVFDGRTVAADGYRRATSTILDIATMQDIATLGIPNASAYYPEWGQQGADHSPHHASPYFYLRQRFLLGGPRCVWSPLILLYFGHGRYEISVSVSCSLVNTTGAYIGQVAVLRNTEKLTTFLRQTAVTPNTEAFIMDGNLYLSAATTATPTARFQLGSDVKVLGPTCTNPFALGNSTAYAVVGCRSSALDYPYPPLQDLAKTDASFLTSPTRTSDYRPLAGSGYYFLVSLPIMQSLQLVLFLPESDVLGDVQQGVVLSIVVCALLCVIGAVLSSVLVATLIGQPFKATFEGTDASFPVVSLTHAFSLHNDLMANCRAVLRADVESGHAMVSTALLASTWSAVVAPRRRQAIDREEWAVIVDKPSSVTHEEAFVVTAHALTAVVDAISKLVARHGGEIVPSPSGIPSCLLLVFRVSTVDDAATRAVLCGLALLEAELVSAAAVTMVDVLRGHTDVFTGGTVVQQASTLLSLATGRQVLVASGVYDDHCMPNVFVANRRDDVAVGVEGVVDGAWRCVPRRVHFERRESSLAALIEITSRPVAPASAATNTRPETR